jgi:CRP/FNR family cyclic AMP-dependent transcriptional regulator
MVCASEHVMGALPDLERLREVGLFGALSDVELSELARAHDVVELGEGDVVFQEGAPGREMFVVLDGKVELFRTVRGVEMLVASRSKNDWFGEMSMLDILPRATTARVVKSVRLLRLTAHDLDVLYRRNVKAYTLLVLNMAREMSRRLRAADALLADLGQVAPDLSPNAR